MEDTPPGIIEYLRGQPQELRQLLLEGWQRRRRRRRRGQLRGQLLLQLPSLGQELLRQLVEGFVRAPHQLRALRPLAAAGAVHVTQGLLEPLPPVLLLPPAGDGQ